MRRSGLIAATLAVVAAPPALALGWLAAASYLFAYLCNTYRVGRVRLDWELTLWYDALPYARGAPKLLGLLVSAAFIPSVVVVLVLIAIVARLRAVRWRRVMGTAWGAPLRPVERADSDNHGHADWMSLAEARRRFQPDLAGEPGLVIGEAVRMDLSEVAGLEFKPRDKASWGPGGKSPLLVDPCTEGPTHSIFVSGSGGGKTASIATRLMHWHGSAIVVDPSDEIADLTEQARDAMGQRVVRIGLGSGDLDLLGGIDPSSPTAMRRVLSVVGSLCGEERERDADSIFDDAGRNMVAALLGHMLWDEHVAPEHRNLHTLRDLITTAEKDMKLLLAGIATSSACTAAKLGARTLMGLAEETFSGAYFSATQLTRWMLDDAAADFLSGTSFSPREVTERPTTVYIHVGLDALKFSPGIVRAALDAFAWAFIEANGHYHSRTLIIPDEMGTIGRVVAFELLRDTGRKYGATLHLPHLSETEIDEVWGRRGKAGCDLWFPNLSWRGYARVLDRRTQESLSKELGEHGVQATSEGDNRGTSNKGFELGTRSRGRNTNRHEIKRSLIKPDEIREARADEMFVLAAGCAPIRCGVPLYFRREWENSIAGSNRFVRHPAVVEAAE